MQFFEKFLNYELPHMIEEKTIVHYTTINVKIRKEKKRREKKG